MSNPRVRGTPIRVWIQFHPDFRRKAVIVETKDGVIIPCCLCMENILWNWDRKVKHAGEFLPFAEVWSEEEMRESIKEKEAGLLCENCRVRSVQHARPSQDRADLPN